MEKDSSEIFRKLKENVSTYAELKLELLKLNTYESVGKVIAVLSYGVMLLCIVFFTILFILLAFGFYISELCGSTSIGFTVIAFLYLLLIGIIVLNKKNIHNKVLNVVISAFMTNEDKPNISTNNEQTTDTTRETDF